MPKILAIENPVSVGKATSDYQTILVERNEHIGIVTLNRPKEFNALNFQLVEELIGALEEFDNDDEVRCIVITGANRSSGGNNEICRS